MSEDTGREGESRSDPMDEAPSENPSPLPLNAMRVMAAVARRPFGMRSTHDVGQAAGVPDATADRILRRLQNDGLLCIDTQMLVERGKAGKATVWKLNLSPRVLKMLPVLSRVKLPDPWSNRPPPTKVPPRFWHHFWNADPTNLALPHDAHYAADRLLLSSDPAAWGWGLNSLPVDSLAGVARSRGADPRTRAMIRNFITHST